MLKGIGASRGYGIGKAVVIKDCNLDYKQVKYAGAEEEKKKLHTAVDTFVEETKTLAENLKQSAGEKEAEILEGHLVMLQDPFMLAQMEENIDGGMTAEAGVDTVCSMFIDMFSGVDDELTRQRASDIKDIKDSLLRILLGEEAVDISAVPKNSVLIAKDFTPSMTSQINKDNVSAIVTEVGGVTSHSAILARAMGIPAVLSVVGAVDSIADGEQLIVDGFKGKVFISPSDAELEEYSAKQQAYLEERESLNEYFGKPTVTKSGIVKKVYGNIGKAEDAQNVVQNGGEGIGLSARNSSLWTESISQPRMSSLRLIQPWQRLWTTRRSSSAPSTSAVTRLLIIFLSKKRIIRFWATVQSDIASATRSCTKHSFVQFCVRHNSAISKLCFLWLQPLTR